MIFDNNFDFWQKLDFHTNLDFWQIFRFFTKVLIFDNKLKFWQKTWNFDKKLEILTKKLEILTKKTWNFDNKNGILKQSWIFDKLYWHKKYFTTNFVKKQLAQGIFFLKISNFCQKSKNKNFFVKIEIFVKNTLKNQPVGINWWLFVKWFPKNFSTRNYLKSSKKLIKMFFSVLVINTPFF